MGHSGRGGNGRFFLLIVIIIALNLWRGWQSDQPPSARRPVPQPTQPQPPDYGQPLAPLAESSATDPIIAVGLGRKTSSTGTAFAVDRRGIWVTARHVVDQCDVVQLRFPTRRGLAVGRVVTHDDADLALLFTAAGRLQLPLVAHHLQIGQHGYHVGYPRGRAGEVWSTLLGRRRMRVRGRYRTNEPVVAWAEHRRRPGNLESLGGLSGGPALNGGGQVVGTLVAESRRRGRVYTAAPVSLRQLLVASSLADADGSVAITPRTLRARADALRQRSAVAKVICLVAKS